MQSSICRRILRLRVINFKCQWCSVSSILTMRSWENVVPTCSNLRLSDAVVITYTSPVITAIAAALLLGEAWGKLDALGSVLCMLGVMLISALAALPYAICPAAPVGAGWTGKTRIYDSTTFYDLGKPGFVMSAFGFPAEPIPLNGLIGAVLAAVMSSAVYLLVRVLKGARGEVGACRLVFPSERHQDGNSNFMAGFHAREILKRAVSSCPCAFTAVFGKAYDQ